MVAVVENKYPIISCKNASSIFWIQSKQKFKKPGFDFGRHACTVVSQLKST